MRGTLPKAGSRTVFIPHLGGNLCGRVQHDVDDLSLCFGLRHKRMIKSSGMNVYPSRVEEVLCKHPAVKDACVIGIPDRAQAERVKGYVVLKDPSMASKELEKEKVEHCGGHLMKWSYLREIEFRDDLPKTLVGKIACKTLEEAEIAALPARGDYTGER